MPITVLTELKTLLDKVESPSLRLEKYVRLEKNSKRSEIDAVVSCHGRFRKPIPKLDPLPPGSQQFTAKLMGRLIINQAGGILENAGLCLHRHFGDPYIPGSAVKGIARHAAWCEWNEAQDDGKKQQIATAIVRVFGYPTGDEGLDNFIEPDKKSRKASAGTIAFLSAFPEGSVRLVTDIVNCHHRKYYAKDPKQPFPADNEDTNPQFFPAIEAGCAFRFTLIPLQGFGLDSSLHEHAKQWLLQAIEQQGAGAKTAAGYGWFSFDREAERLEQQRLEVVKLKIAEAESKAAELNAMSPIDRAMVMILELASEPYSHFAKNLKDKSEDEQRAFIQLLKTNKDKKEWWKRKKRMDEVLAKSIKAIAEDLKEALQW